MIVRAVVLFVLVLLSVPGAVLNIPMGLISRILARREARKALAKSEVKVKAQDVIASYKVIRFIVTCCGVLIFFCNR